MYLMNYTYVFNSHTLCLPTAKKTKQHGQETINIRKLIVGNDELDPYKWGG
jgi:hypothetical protein